MKSTTILPFLFIATILCVGQPRHHNKVVETIAIDLDGDRKSDTILLSNPPVGKPGDFNEIVFRLSGSTTHRYTANDVWSVVDQAFLDTNKNSVDSKRIFVFRDSVRSYALLFGTAYDSGRNEFTVISIDRNGAHILFDSAFSRPVRILTSKDGTTSLIGRISRPRFYRSGTSRNVDTISYQPYSAFRLDTTWAYVSSMSKVYNKENYVWFGPKDDPNLIIGEFGDSINGIPVHKRTTGDSTLGIAFFVAATFAVILPLLFFIGICFAALYGFLFFLRKDILNGHMKRFLRVLFCSIVIAVGCGMSAALAMTFSLPPNDQAHHMGGLILLDPFILIPVSLVSLALGSILSVFFYDSTVNKNLFRSSIVVALIGIFCTATTSYLLNMFIAIPIGLLGVIATLFGIKYSSDKMVN